MVFLYVYICNAYAMLVIKCNNKNVRDSIIITIGFSISSIPVLFSPYAFPDVQKEEEKKKTTVRPFFFVVFVAVGRLGGMWKITKV